MALFGKSDSVSSLLKKIQADSQTSPEKLAEMLELVGASPDFLPTKNLWMLAHSKGAVRKFLHQRLLELADPELADRLVKEIPGKPPNVRLEIARLVNKTAPDRVAAHLAGLIHSKKKELREAGIDLIAKCGDWHEYLGYLKAALRDPEPSIRNQVARLLVTDIENETVFLLLRSYINDEDAGLRRIIIEAFAKSSRTDIVEPFFERLLLEDHEERTIMLSALSRLARRAQSQIEERILPMLGDEEPQVRDMAARLLQDMPDQMRLLRSFLVHTQTMATWLRERSFESIQKVASNLGESILELLGDPDPTISVGAMIMAKGSTDERLIPALLRIFEGDQDWWIRSMAAELLGTFPQPEVTQRLIARIDDTDLSYSVISVLGEQGNSAGLQALLQKLADPKPGLRRATLRALQPHAQDHVAQAIATVARDDPDDDVRRIARQVLREQGERNQRLLRELENEEERILEERIQSSGPAIELEMANEALND